MATSGTISGSTQTLYKFWAEWTRNSYSIENNTSNITVSLRIQRADGSSSGAYNLDTKPSVSLKINGVLQTPSINYINTQNKFKRRCHHGQGKTVGCNF